MPMAGPGCRNASARVRRRLVGERHGVTIAPAVARITSTTTTAATASSRRKAADPSPHHRRKRHGAASRHRERQAIPRQACGALRFDCEVLRFTGPETSERTVAMSPTKLAVAEAEINLRCAEARKAGDLAGMQRAMADLTALYRAYYGTVTINRP
jgi:hypothetical protein